MLAFFFQINIFYLHAQRWVFLEILSFSFLTKKIKFFYLSCKGIQLRYAKAGNFLFSNPYNT